jgi:excisionase family DNA binding protein
MVELLNVAEVARYLKVHQATIYRLLKRHEIPAFRVGGKWRLNRLVIDQWMKEREAIDGLKVV